MIFSQYIPVAQHKNDVYSFLDELTLPYNPVVRPLGRDRISELLYSIDGSQLTLRQQNELAFYLKDYNKERYLKGQYKKRIDLFYHKDSVFSLTVNPIVGSDLWVNKNGFEYHWWNGAEAQVAIGRWGIYGSMRDNHESSVFTDPYYLENNPGGTGIKVLSGGRIDYAEIHGGITYSFHHGHISFIKDNFSWGTNYHGANIFSGRPPSFVRLEISVNPVKWFDFHYFHGWLNSEVVDSTRSFYVTNAYGTKLRRVYHRKFIAANMFTFYPLTGLGLSFGNSIIYDYEQVHPAFLIPVMFFKALDHTLNYGIKNMNSQMFFNVSSKNLEHIHFYSTLFIDELSVKRITDPDSHNFLSFKGGVRISNLIANTFACFEYTVSNALVFRHDVPTTTFESNRFNLGHYLGDNAREVYLSAGYKPLRNFLVEFSYTGADKGPDHTGLGTLPRDAIKPFTPLVWKSKSINFQTSWQVLNDLYIRFGFEWRNVTGDQEALLKYTPAYYHGKTKTLNIGVNYGF